MSNGPGVRGSLDPTCSCQRLKTESPSELVSRRADGESTNAQVMSESVFSGPLSRVSGQGQASLEAMGGCSILLEEARGKRLIGTPTALFGVETFTVQN